MTGPTGADAAAAADFLAPSRLVLLADELRDVFPTMSSDERADWLRAYLRRAIHRRRVARDDAWERLERTIEMRVARRRAARDRATVPAA